MAAAEDINETELDNYIIEEHDAYLSDLVSKNNKWMNILLSSTGLNAEILMLYNCLREPGQYNYRKFKETVKLNDDNSVKMYMKEIITNINLIIGEAPKYDKDIVVWRGLTNPNLPKNDKTMLSTSIKYSVADSFSNPENIHKIIIPAGMPFLYLESHTKTKDEHECLLPFGCVFSDYKTLQGDEKTIIERTVMGVDDVDTLISDQFINLLRTKKTKMDSIITKTKTEQERRLEEKLARLSKRKGKGRRKSVKSKPIKSKRVKAIRRKTKRRKTIHRITKNINKKR
tara:strand:+ start:262 stop:1119 length:858 start_codon:yes stop_codon:yes gene_type:complete